MGKSLLGGGIGNSKPAVADSKTVLGDTQEFNYTKDGRTVKVSLFEQGTGDNKMLNIYARAPAPGWDKRAYEMKTSMKEFIENYVDGLGFAGPQKYKDGIFSRTGGRRRRGTRKGRRASRRASRRRVRK